MMRHCTIFLLALLSAHSSSLLSQPLSISNSASGNSLLLAIQIITIDKKQRLLLIAGHDCRGTAYGVFELSRRPGVSPLYWWAAVTPEKQKSLYIRGSYIAHSPSVQYRGIFLNGEDRRLPGPRSLDGKLQLSDNAQKAQITEPETPIDNARWRQNVLQGFAESTTKHSFKHGNNTITLYILNLDMGINNISIY